MHQSEPEGKEVLTFWSGHWGDLHSQGEFAKNAHPGLERYDARAVVDERKAGDGSMFGAWPV